MPNMFDHERENLSQEDFGAILEALNATAIVSMTNAKGDILYVNDKFVEVSKYDRDELIGQNHRILKSGDQPDDLFVGLWKTISSGKAWRGEIKNRAKDGEYYWVDTSIAPVFGTEGKPDRYVSVRFLITDKKRIEEELNKEVKTLTGRELRMVELKKRIEELEEALAKKG